jgi:hypothetical protein
MVSVAFVVAVLVASANFGTRQESPDGGSQRRAASAGAEDPPFEVSLPSEHTDFVIPSTSSGPTYSMDLTFPDGSSASVDVPRSLGLAEMGAVPIVQAFLTGACGSELIIRPYDLRGPYIAHSPLRSVADGTFLFKATSGLADYYLVRVAEPWMILVPCDGSRSEVTEAATDWATLLTFTTTSADFLLAQATPPLEMPGASSSRGPALHFGDGRDLVQISPTPRCESGLPFVEPGFGHFCQQTSTGGLDVVIWSERAAFVADLMTTFNVQRVALASSQ